MTTDTCVTIVPYFKIKPGCADAFRALTELFVAKAQTESGCLYYGFSFDGDMAHCREGYENAAGLLVHLQNVASLIQEAGQLAETVTLELHGCAAELDKLREPLKDMPAKWFVLENGFRK
ncbi:putative quinol monooxygenase [Synoicihabitans lomoniglobus]|uniref:ABM domain-containing protein n=1 Tax=Synoicihabitans lomoniglobus TaxID=2909285 RepID=A0AAF0CNS8_9BACT|nr:hypothetical protein [Opitutaceae bacterium LMO-M01]WED64775.1 hypothetical protein PXH66_20720 [Opitutaceae bacterium LMO-M01]